MISDRELQNELQALRALGAELVQRTSRLQDKLAPVQGRASNKKVDPVRQAIERRNRRLLKRNP